MKESRVYVLKQTAFLAAGLAVCVAAMCGIYALLGHFSGKILLSGIVGLVIAAANFFVMAVVATLAADRAGSQDVDGGKKLVQGSYPLRLLALGSVIALCAISGYFDLLALVLPLLFVRPVLMVQEFFGKKG